ncbi:hypothetical protein STEG23_030875, partial [Scotinomys teguina]
MEKLTSFSINVATVYKALALNLLCIWAPLSCGGWWNLTGITSVRLQVEEKCSAGFHATMWEETVLCVVCRVHMCHCMHLDIREQPW